MATFPDGNFLLNDPICFSDFDYMDFWRFAEFYLKFMVCLRDCCTSSCLCKSFHPLPRSRRAVWWLPRIQSRFLGEYCLLQLQDTIWWICSPGLCPRLLKGGAHDPSQVHPVLPPWNWNLDQRDKEIGHDGLTYHLSTYARTRHACFPFPKNFF